MSLEGVLEPAAVLAFTGPKSSCRWVRRVWTGVGSASVPAPRRAAAWTAPPPRAAPAQLSLSQCICSLKATVLRGGETAGHLCSISHTPIHFSVLGGEKRNRAGASLFIPATKAGLETGEHKVPGVLITDSPKGTSWFGLLRTAGKGGRSIDVSRGHPQRKEERRGGSASPGCLPLPPLRMPSGCPCSRAVLTGAGGEAAQVGACLGLRAHLRAHSTI